MYNFILKKKLTINYLCQYPLSTASCKQSITRDVGNALGIVSGSEKVYSVVRGVGIDLQHIVRNVSYGGGISGLVGKNIRTFLVETISTIMIRAKNIKSAIAAG